MFLEFLSAIFYLYFVCEAMIKKHLDVEELEELPLDEKQRVGDLYDVDRVFHVGKHSALYIVD